MTVDRVVSSAFLVVTLSSTALAQATLTGFVREDATLKPMKDVDVVIEQPSKRARTDDKGKFTLRDLPAGNVVVQVRRLGYEPIAMTLELTGGTKEQVFYLKTAVTQLDTVTAKAPRPRGLGREAFEERRKFGLGKFIDSVELRKNEHRKAQDLFRELGVRVVTPPTCTPQGVMKQAFPMPAPGGGRMGITPRNPPYCSDIKSMRVASSASVTHECPMMVVLDGVVLYRPAQGGGGAAAQTGGVDQIEWERTFDLNAINVAALQSVEIYRRTAEIPIEFSGSASNCGVLVLWQRR